MSEYIDRNKDVVEKEKIFDFIEDNRPTDIAMRALHGANNTPTVDVKPIVHAHWIEGQTDNPNIHNILCSHCFEGYPSDSQYTKKKFQWCPHCVARH